MTRTARTRLAVVTTTALAGIALAGCGVGGPANGVTIYQKNAGSNVAIQVSDGSINLRDLYIVPPASGSYPSGGTAPLSLVAFNNTANPITITAVSLVAPPTPQPGSTSGAVSGSVSFVPATGTGTAPSAGASPSTSASASPSRSAHAPASASPSGSSSPAASATANPGSGLSITIPAGGYLRLSPATGAYLALTNLSQDLPFGKAVGLTFTFSTGDSVTVQVSFGDPTAAPATTPTAFPVGG